MSADTLKNAPPEQGTKHKPEANAPDPAEANNAAQNSAQYVNQNAPDAEPIRIVMAGLDNNVDAFAREATHEDLSKIDKSAPFLRRFAKSVWHTMTREYQIVKRTGENRDEILAHNNLRHHHGKSDERWREAVVKRYSSEFGDKLVRTEAGETFHKLGDPEAPKDPNAERIRNDTLDLVRQFAKGDITDEASLESMLDRLREDWRNEGISQDYIGEGQILAHNVTKVARQVKAALDARAGLDAVAREAALDQILAGAEVITGEAKVGSNVEIDKTVSERLAEKMRGAPFLNEGRIARVTSFLGNEVVVAAMMSAALYGGKRALTSTMLPGLGAGIIAGIRERRAMRDERALAARRIASGQELDMSNKAQVEIHETLHETTKSSELIAQLGALYDQDGKLKMKSRAELEQALKLQGDIRALIILEAQAKGSKKANLIDYAEGDSDAYGDRLFDLEAAMSKLETDIAKQYTDVDAVNDLEINPGEEYADMLQANIDVALGALSKQMREKDKLFNRRVWKRGFKRGVITAFTVVGVHELTDVIADATDDAVGFAASVLFKMFGSAPYGTNAGPALALLKSDLVGFVGGPVDTEQVGGGPVDATKVGAERGPVDATEVGAKNGPVNTTRVGGGPVDTTQVGGGPVDATRVGGEGGPINATHVGSEGGPVNATQVGEQVLPNGKTVEINDRNKVTLPEGFKIAANGETASVTGPNGQTFAVDLNKDGSISEKSLQEMRDRGFKVYDRADTVEGKPKVTHEKVQASEFVQNHKHEMVKIKHESWYTNNTSKYDLGELQLDNGLQKDGSVVVSIERMTGNGSFEGNDRVNWREAAKDGKLMVYLSASKGSQANAFEIPMSPSGRLLIENDHPARALFDNEGKFIGGYQEIAVKGGKTADGATKIATLATVVGRGGSPFNDTVSTPTFATTHNYIIVPPTEMVPRASVSEMQEDGGGIGVPIYARRRFGEAKQNNASRPAAAPKNTPNSGGFTTGAQPNNMNGNAYTAPNGAPNTSAGASQETGTGATGPTTAEAKTGNMGGQGEQKTGDKNDDGKQTNEQKTTTGEQKTADGEQKTTTGAPYERDKDQFTPAEHEALEKLGKSKLVMPEGFTADFTDVNPLSQKIAISLLADVLRHTPRQTHMGNPESLKMYRFRVMENVRIRAGALAARLDMTSPGARPIFAEAFGTAVARISEVVPAQRPRQPQGATR